MYLNSLTTIQRVKSYFLSRREKLKDGWYFDCECPRCKDPSELGLLTSATLCLRCTDGVILPEDPTSSSDKSPWLCGGCGFKTTSLAADKLTEYFLGEMAKLSPEQLEQWESLLDKASRMLHPNHYVLTLIRINMNAGYIRLAGRVGMKAEEVPVEVFMRRRDLLDEIHRVVELAEPGLTRRRGEK